MRAAPELGDSRSVLHEILRDEIDLDVRRRDLHATDARSDLGAARGRVGGRALLPAECRRAPHHDDLAALRSIICGSTERKSRAGIDEMRETRRETRHR